MIKRQIQWSFFVGPHSTCTLTCRCIFSLLAAVLEREVIKNLERQMIELGHTKPTFYCGVEMPAGPTQNVFMVQA